MSVSNRRTRKFRDADARTSIRLADPDKFTRGRQDQLIRSTVETLNELGFPAVVTDPAGVIQACNPAAVAWYGCGTESLVGCPLVSGVLAGNDLNGASLISAAIATGHWQGSMTLEPRDGGAVHTDVRATPLLDHGGRPAGVLVIFLDSSELDPPLPVAFRNLPELGIGERVAVLDGRGEIVEVNGAWQASARQDGDASDPIGVNYLEICERARDPFADRVAAGIRQLLKGSADRFELMYPCHSPTQERWFSMLATKHLRAGLQTIVVAHRDVSDLRGQFEREHLQTVLLDEVGVAVHATDLDRRVLSWNAGAERLFGWTAGEAVGRTVAELVIPSEVQIDGSVRQRIGEGPWEGEVTMARKGGETFPAYVRTRLIEDLENGQSAIVAVTEDLTERRRAERELNLAQDHLRAVTDSVGEGMFTIDTEGRVTYINPMAEELLGWRKEDLVGKVMHNAIHFRNPDGTPFPIEDCPIVRAGRDGETKRIDDDIFVRHDGASLPVAYTASPFATDAGIEGCVIVFRNITQRKAERRRVELEIGKLGALKRVREALDDELFVLYAQPIIDLADGAEVQRELLIRMRDPDGSGGIVAPGSFLPVAEEFGLVLEIDRWVIDRAADVAASGLPVELNISAVSIGDHGLISHIAQAFARTGADPANVIFELTETALLSAEAEGVRFVEWLHAFGCGVALDDFGTGYGGFTYLKQLPIDLLKIDIEFVRDVLINPASRNVVEAIVGLAERFGLRTVAEGVEDAETLTLLRELGVDRAQGYHIGRPAPLKVELQGAHPGQPVASVERAHADGGGL